MYDFLFLKRNNLGKGIGKNTVALLGPSFIEIVWKLISQVNYSYIY